MQCMQSSSGKEWNTDSYFSWQLRNMVSGQAVLQDRIDREEPRNHLDFRHRLDGEGKRYGKMIEYRYTTQLHPAHNWLGLI
jgi:hypothetical protein